MQKLVNVYYINTLGEKDKAIIRPEFLDTFCEAVGIDKEDVSTIEEYKPRPTKHTRYSVATLCGGIMEDPELHYENQAIIIASSKEEAEEIYNKRFSCYYYTGQVLSELGGTNEPKTSSEYINKETERGKREWLLDGKLTPLKDLKDGDIFVIKSRDVMKEYVKIGAIDDNEVRVKRVGFDKPSVVSKDAKVLKVGELK